MAKPQTTEIEAPALTLSACAVDEHCRALQRIGRLPFWWYQGVSRVFGNFALPFQDRRGTWWYGVKPGLSWAVDCFAPIDYPVRLPLARTLHGFQHVVSREQDANSHFVINAVTDLAGYGTASIDSKRRNSIRKGLRSCDLAVVRAFDNDAFDQCRVCWNELTERTGWKHLADKASFDDSWRMLLDCPGVSIIAGRDRESGQVAGFLVTKIIGDTAYVDTIASRTDLLKTNVNDAVMFAFMAAARQLPGVRKAHYAIRSYVESLERFKHGLGFVPVPFPARTKLRWPTRVVLNTWFRDQYRRMLGRFDEPAAAPAAPAAPAGGADAADKGPA